MDTPPKITGHSTTLSSFPQDTLASPPDQDLEWSLESDPELRYRVEGKLGEGGLGMVMRVYDRNVGRRVARKTLVKGQNASPKEQHLFIKEACITGSLEHPNIIPIYDIGKLTDGQLYYTMPLISSPTLEEAIQRKELSLIQFVKILQQICMGLEYAHSRSVIHRDIKPQNILLGEFGEVYILDWGIAEEKSIESVGSVLERIPTLYDPEGTPNHALRIRGTPGYMPPETFTSMPITPACDQYALGVILYRILTGQFPHRTDEARDLASVLYRISCEPLIPPRQAAPHQEVPEELEQLCIRMLAKRAEDRFSSCREVYNRLEEFLEGTQEKERRRAAAAIRLKEASTYETHYLSQCESASALHLAWEEMRNTLDPWASLEQKRPVWQKREDYLRVQQESISLFGQAIQKYTQALEQEPRNETARQGLARLYWRRFLEAERSHEQLQKIYYLDQALFFDDGTYRTLLKTPSSIAISTDPSGATLQICRYREEDNQFALGYTEFHEESPALFSLTAGSYMLIIQKEGYRPTFYPLCVRRGHNQQSHIRLYTELSIGKPYVYIPAGTFTCGGDDKASWGLPAREVMLDDFLISQYPISFQDYLLFLNDLHRRDPEMTKQHLPRTGQEFYVKLDETENYVVDRSMVFHGTITERYRPNQGHEENLPIFGISWFDAVLYCRWRSQQEGRLITLPTEEQWEKAAAGVDQRPFPWGHEFEPLFCKMGLSRPMDELQPEPLGTFEKDVSPYGVRDVVGTIGEWTRTIVVKGKPINLSPDELDLLQNDPKYTPVQRGGGWVVNNPFLMRIGSRLSRPAGTPTYNAGFRVVTYPRT